MNYDGTLRLYLEEGARTIGFADDLAVLVRAGYFWHLEKRADIELTRVTRWIKRHNLEIAPDKTDVVTLKGP